MAGETGVLSVLLNAEAIEIVTERPAGSVARLLPSPIGLSPPAGGHHRPRERKNAPLRGDQEGRGGNQEGAGQALDESFVNGAPAEVVAEHRAREANWKSRLEALRATLSLASASPRIRPVSLLQRAFRKAGRPLVFCSDSL